MREHLQEPHAVARRSRCLLCGDRDGLRPELCFHGLPLTVMIDIHTQPTRNSPAYPKTDVLDPPGASLRSFTEAA